MYNNNQFTGNQQFGFAPQQGAASYGQQQQIPKFTNPLGEKIKSLRKNGNGLPQLAITEDAMNRAICTHRDPYTNEPTAYEVSQGHFRCDICGAEWDMIENVSTEEIETATKNVLDLMHTAKCQWLDIPDKICTDNFQVMAVIEQLPQILAIASARNRRYNNMQTAAPQYQNQYGNAFNAWNSLTGGVGFGAGMMPQQAMMGGYQQAAMMGGFQQPYMVPQQMGYAPTPMQQMAAGNGMNAGFGNIAPQQPAATPEATATTPAPAPAPEAAAPEADNATVSATLTV